MQAIRTSRSARSCSDRAQRHGGAAQVRGARTEQGDFMKKVIAAGVVACMSTLASAQQAGDNVATLGWLHIMPQDSTNGLTTNLANMPINGPLRLPGSFTSPGTSLTVNNADTVGLTLTHFFTDHIAVTSVLGVPPEFTLTGHGVIRPPGPSGALGSVDMDKTSNQPAVKNARQWSPTVILQYYFNAPTAKFRPFVGIGVAYSWFSNIELNGNFARDINENLGSVLAAGAGKPGPTSVEGKASSSFYARLQHRRELRDRQALGADGNADLHAAEDLLVARDQGGRRLDARHHAHQAEGRSADYVRRDFLQVLSRAARPARAVRLPATGRPFASSGPSRFRRHAAICEERGQFK
jgi:outer membrane protein